MANVSGKRRELTKRARILSEVLDCVNRDDYEYFDEYLIIGGSFDDLLECAEWVTEPEGSEHVRRSREILRGIKEAVSDIPTVRGRRSAQRRASLDRMNGPPSVRGLARLEAVAAGGIADALREAVNLPSTPGTTENPFERELDDLDAAFAREVLDRLPKIVKRVSGLAHLDVQHAPSERVRHCFEEAHRCYLYGFPVACVVLCRGIVESAIEDVLGPREQAGRVPARKTEKPGRDSDLKYLIEQAKRDRILSGYGADCAHDVRRDGNSAVHPDAHGKIFREISTGERAREVLDKTRIVLEELGHVKAK